MTFSIQNKKDIDYSYVPRESHKPIPPVLSVHFTMETK